MFGYNMFSGIRGRLFSIIAGMILSPGLWKMENKIMSFMKNLFRTKKSKKSGNASIICPDMRIQPY